MDEPISLAVILASGMSLSETLRGSELVYFDASITLLFFLLIGRYLDLQLRGRARSAAENLTALRATAATVVDAEGHLVSVPIIRLEPGMTSTGSIRGSPLRILRLFEMLFGALAKWILQIDRCRAPASRLSSRRSGLGARPCPVLYLFRLLPPSALVPWSHSNFLVLSRSRFCRDAVFFPDGGESCQ